MLSLLVWILTLSDTFSQGKGSRPAPNSAPTRGLGDRAPLGGEQPAAGPQGRNATRRGLRTGAEPWGRGRGVKRAIENEFSVDLPKLRPLAARENGGKKRPERSKSFPERLAALPTSTLRGREPDAWVLPEGKSWKRLGFQIWGVGGARKTRDPGSVRCC